MGFHLIGALQDIADAQARDETDGSTDALLTLSTGAKVRGRVARPVVGDTAVTIWPVTPAAPRGSEIPMHVDLGHLIVVEWAVNDYSEEG